jgi:hypothetical protein
MLPKRNKNVQELADEVVTRYTAETATSSFARTDLLADMPGRTLRNIRPAVIDSNKWIDFICEGNEDLYEKNKYRIFSDHIKGLQVVRGKEIEP